MIRWSGLAGFIVLLVSGCSNASYYWQAIAGQAEILRAARPIDKVLQSPNTSTELRRKLSYVLEARAFASRDLHLPDNLSYRRYADLQRPFVVWNVFATEEFSVAARTWCFPFAGCVAYRGYFNKDAAETFARSLRVQGMDVFVGGVPAYSTLGWLNDPVMNTFIHYPEPELARLLFHELAHQVVYVKDDSRFNESFATTAEEVGLDRWLVFSDQATRESVRVAQSRKQDFFALIAETREKLKAIYDSGANAAVLRREKRHIFSQMKANYLRLKSERWGNFSGYDAWFAQDLGNAHLIPIVTYTDLVPGFKRLLARNDGDLTRFYDAVRTLARLPPAERQRMLE